MYKKTNLNNLYRLIFLIILFSSISISCGNKNWQSKWIVVGSMNAPRAGAGAVIVNDNLYIIGGIQGKEKGILTSCEWARIDKGGNIGKFNYTSNLVIPRGFIAAVEFNGWIYAIGGANGEHGSNLLNSAERAKINPDGTLGEWILEKNKMFSARRGVTAFTSKDYIYAVGGFNGEFLDTVERAKVLEDGSLGKWELVSQIMNVRRYIHGSAAAGNYIYVVGGHERESGGALNKVEWSYIDDKGELAEWKKAPHLNMSRFLTAAIGNKGYIFVIGGYDGNYINAVEMAKMNSDGSLNKWNLAAPLKTPRASMAVTAYRDYIYVIGGATAPNGIFLNTIERAAINSKGELGNYM